VERAWAGLLGVGEQSLWRGVHVSGHAGLGDYPGIVVAARDSGCHVSLPSRFPAEEAESLAGQEVSRLIDASFWRTLPATSDRDVLGPSIHAYTDEDPGAPASVALVDAGTLTTLRDAVPAEEWREGGFDDDAEVFFAVEADGRVAAAANLTSFAGGPTDVGVLVHPQARGTGLGALVGRAAASYAVREHGIARWRARTDNVPSRRTAARLGFEAYCRQLAVR
jgi:RimJ/RimL family protein N-acetyltransferase